MNFNYVIFKVIIVFFLLSHNVLGKEYNWLLIYYMPYDNNLSPFSQNIVQQFSKAKIPENLCITLQVDLAGKSGMTRYFFNSKVDSVNLDEEESTSSKVLDDYLFWASKMFKAKHYSIILLNHGGGLNQYGLDEDSGVNRWMQIDSVAMSIENFNRHANISKIDLLFEQVCVRGTLENIYEFREVARYTLVSQDLVPAPGYYYPKLFYGLKNDSIISGDKLSDLIVNSEREDMYYSYTLVDNSKWDEWIKLLEKFSKKLDVQNSKIIGHELKIVNYSGDSYYDFTSLINAIYSEKAFRKTSESIRTFTNKVLIKRLYVNSKFERTKGLSGLSICSPFKLKNSTLAIYSVKPYTDALTKLRNLAKVKQ